MPPVRLQLRLTGALRADGRAAGAALPLQMAPHADQPGQQVLVLRQLHLQAALLRPGALGEDVQYQAASVQHLHAAQLRQHPHLRRGQIVVEDHHGGLAVFHHALDLLHLALADEAVGVGLLAALQYHAHGLAARRLHQRAELRQALLVGAVRAQHRGLQAHQHRVVPRAVLILFNGFSFHNAPRCNGIALIIPHGAAKKQDPHQRYGSCDVMCPYLSRPKRLLNLATRPPVSTSFCLPVKKG